MLDREQRYLGAEILNIRQKAKDSEVLTPTPEQIEFRRKIFDEVNIATVESGAIPRLLELTEHMSGVPHTTIVFDTVELSTGSPFPTPTRYVVPITEDEIQAWLSDEEDKETLEEEMKNIKIPDFIPGLVIRRWPAGMTGIQIGIDMKAEGHKVYKRIHTVSHHWKEGNSFSQPYWWPHEGVAQDLTQQYDLLIPTNLKIALIYGDDMDQGLGYFTVGGQSYGSQVREVNYSTKTPNEEAPNVVWTLPDNQQETEKGFQYLGSYADLFPDRYGKEEEPNS